MAKRAVLLLVCFVGAFATSLPESMPTDLPPEASITAEPEMTSALTAGTTKGAATEEPTAETLTEPVDGKCPANSGTVACWDGFEKYIKFGTLFQRIGENVQTLWKCAKDKCEEKDEKGEKQQAFVGNYDQADTRCCKDGDYCEPAYGSLTCAIKISSDNSDFDHYESGCVQCQESRPGLLYDMKGIKSCLKVGQNCGHSTPTDWIYGCCDDRDKCRVEKFPGIKSTEKSSDITDEDNDEDKNKDGGEDNDEDKYEDTGVAGSPLPGRKLVSRRISDVSGTSQVRYEDTGEDEAQKDSNHPKIRCYQATLKGNVQLSGCSACRRLWLKDGPRMYCVWGTCKQNRYARCCYTDLCVPKRHNRHRRPNRHRGHKRPSPMNNRQQTQGTEPTTQQQANNNNKKKKNNNNSNNNNKPNSSDGRRATLLSLVAFVLYCLQISFY